MFRLSMSNLIAKKLRLLTTSLAIVLGVAFTTGTMILADTMSASFGDAIDQLSDGVDTVVRGEKIGDSGPGTPRRPVPLTDLDRIRAVDGIAAVAPYWEGYAQVIALDGKALDLPQSVGLNWIDDPALSMFELIAGTAPARPGEVVLGDDTADAAALSVGDGVDVITSAGRETFRVVGLSRFDGGAEFGATAFTFFHADDAAARLGTTDSTARVLVRGDGSLSDDALSAAVARSVPAHDVVTGAQHADEMRTDVGSVVGVFETVLLVFGGIALLVGSFTIANTFTITVAQRTKELALVRAIGASRRQVLGSVVTEAAVLGIIAAVVGLAAGVGIAEALTAILGAAGLEFPARALVIQSSTVVAAVATGLLVTVAAAIVPARRAASVAPVEAMRDATIERAATGRRRALVGTGAALLGGAGLVLGAVGGSATAAGVGTLACFGAAIALGPVLVGPVTGAIAIPVRRLGVSGRLAAANTLRNPRRSAATAAALTIGVMLVAGASMFTATARDTILGDVDDVVASDRVVRPIGANPGVPTTLSGELASVPGLRVVPMQVVDADVAGDDDTVAGIDLAAAGDLLRIEVVEGTFDAARSGIVVGDRAAESRGWAVGDSLAVTFPDGATVTLPVVAVMVQSTALPAVIAPYGTVAAHGDDLDRMVLVAGDGAALTAAQGLVDLTPTAELDTVRGYAVSLAGPLEMLLSLVIGFLGLAVVIAVLGIATTIGLAVHERTRELGVLRAVGMTRRQVRRAIRLESITIALFGTVTGLVLGLGCTAAILSTLTDDGFSAPVVPVTAVAAIAVAAVVAGAVAAALPARRAARLEVLDAIRTA